MHFNICAYIKCIFPFPHNPKVAYINRYAVSPNFAVKTHLKHTLAVALGDAVSVSQVSHLAIL